MQDFTKINLICVKIQMSKSKRHAKNAVTHETPNQLKANSLQKKHLRARINKFNISMLGKIAKNPTKKQTETIKHKKLKINTIQK